VPIFWLQFRGEVDKGPFGIQGQFLYLNASDGVYPPGLVSKIDLRIQQFLGDFGVSYRLLQGPHGWIDLRAGFRYTNLGQDLRLEPNGVAIDQASTQLVNQVSDQISTQVSNRVNNVTQQISAAVQAFIQENVLDRLTALQDRDPVLPVGPLAGRRPGIIRDLIQAEIQSRLSNLIADIQARAAAIREKASAAQASAQGRINQLQAQLSNQIATTLKTQLNTSFARTDDWFDPYIGLRGQYNLSKAFYLTAKVDVGGFGVGSDITTQVSAGIGCQITRNIFSEVVFAYLYDDYDSGGLIYRVSEYGPELSLGLKF
jgi:hypothetical protein